MAQAVSYGSITIVDTNDIEEIYMIYASSNSSDSMPTFTYAAVTGGTIWKRDASQITGDYIWQSTVVTKSGVEVTSSNWTNFYGVPVCITGPEGADARKIISVVPYYYLSTSNTGQTGGSWDTTPPAYPSTGTNYYWTKTVTTYDSGSPTESTPVLDMALTNAAKDSRDANSAASQAVSIATDAQENSEGALSIARGVRQHFFWFPEDVSASVPAGAYVAEEAEDSFKSGPTKGNLLTRSDGIWIRNGVDTLAALQGSGLTFLVPSGSYKGKTAMNLSGTALTFYDIDSANKAAATLASTGLVLSKGGIESGTKDTADYLYIYSEDRPARAFNINGSGSKTDWRIVAGKSFGVDKAGNLYASNADISGKITANSGTIGGWSIGTDTNKSLYYSNSTPGASTNNLVLSPSSAKNTNAIGGSAANLTWFISAGRAFGVTTAGKLYATGAEITGKINADTGRIGGSSGWTIASQQISSGSIGSDNSMYLSTKNLAGTVAGKELTTTTPSWRLTVGSNFGVDNTGKVYASGAEINGKITVSAGSNVYTTDSVNPLEIGGRNLLAFSELKNPFPMNAHGLTYTQEDDGWIRVRGTAINTAAGVNPLWMNDSTTTKFGPGTYTLTLEDPDGVFKSGKLSIQVYWNGTTGAKYYIGPGKKTFTNIVTSYIYRIYVYYDTGAKDTVYDGRFRLKLERGNKATDWTPAPEDIDAKCLHYGTCATAIGTAAKVVALSGFALYTGAQITVKFTNGNSAAAPTLNVNSTGAKAVIVNGATSALTGKMDFPAGTTCSFTYDGSHWQLTGTDNIENVMEWTESGGLKVKAKSGSKSMVNVTASAVDIYDKNGKLGNRVNDSGMTVYKGGSKRAEFFDSVNLYASDGSTKIASFAGDGVSLHSTSLQNVGRFYVTSDTKDGKTRTFGTLSLGSSENPVIKGYNYTGDAEDISALIMDVNGTEWDSKFTASLDFTGMEFQQDNVGKWSAGLQSGGFYVMGPSGGLMDVDSSGNGAFAGGLSIGGNALADYVIKRGTSGSWTYMKWASGTAMCYGTITGWVSKWAGWGSLYYGTMQYFNYPSGLFAAEPTLTAQAKMGSGASGDLFSVGFSNDGSASRTPTMYPTRPTAGLTGNIYYQLQAWGRWK